MAYDEVQRVTAECAPLCIENVARRTHLVLHGGNSYAMVSQELEVSGTEQQSYINTTTVRAIRHNVLVTSGA